MIPWVASRFGLWFWRSGDSALTSMGAQAQAQVLKLPLFLFHEVESVSHYSFDCDQIQIHVIYDYIAA